MHGGALGHRVGWGGDARTLGGLGRAERGRERASGMSRLLGLGAEEMGLGRERSGRGGARFGPRMRERRPVGLGYVERGKRAVRGE